MKEFSVNSSLSDFISVIKKVKKNVLFKTIEPSPPQLIYSYQIAVATLQFIKHVNIVLI